MFTFTVTGEAHAHVYGHVHVYGQPYLTVNVLMPVNVNLKTLSPSVAEAE